MAITAIDNQAVKLVTPGNTFQDLTAECDCVGRDFCQLVEREDDTCFQVDLSEATGIELVTEPGFNGACGVNWACGANWTIAGSRAQKSAGGNNKITQAINIAANRYYKVTIIISQLSGGTASVDIGGWSITALTTTGTFTRYVFTNALANSNIEIEGSAAGTVIDVDFVSVKEMSTVGLRIREDDGTLEYEEVDGTSVEYVGAKAQVCVDWTNVTDDGCMHIELMDVALETAELIKDGTFDGGCGVEWTCNGGGVGAWNIAAGVATASTGLPFGYPAAAQRTLQETILLLAGKCYTLTFDILNFNSGTGQVLVDGGAGTPSITVGSWAAAGSFSFPIDLRAETRKIRIRFVASFLTSDYDLDNVSIMLDDECKATLYESECFKLQDTHECTTLFTWTNDDNAFGLNYEDFLFTQSFRHKARLWKPDYAKVDKTTHTDSAGDRRILYSSTVKAQRLGLDLMPEYMHDAFSIAIEHDTFTIDAVEYVNEETDYEPLWNAGALVAGVDLEMKKAEQNLVNANCS